MCKVYVRLHIVKPYLPGSTVSGQTLSVSKRFTLLLNGSAEIGSPQQMHAMKNTNTNVLCPPEQRAALGLPFYINPAFRRLRVIEMRLVV